MNFQKSFYMFVDESGVSHLNHSGQFFVLATIIIEKTDFEIIEGYLRLLKRKYFNNDLLNLHATDLYERPYQKYRKIIRPRNRINAFVMDLHSLLLTIPFESGIYTVDKNIIRNQISYSPGVRKQPPPGVDLNLPYQKCTMKAFFDFAQFLSSKKAQGEITVESRFKSDSEFVKYFDLARSNPLPGNIPNQLATDVKERINSLTISNKKVVDGGLEIADLCAYCAYRKLTGDPYNQLKTNMTMVTLPLDAITKKSYLRDQNNRKIKIQKL